MCCRAVVVVLALFASLALAQTNPTQLPEIPEHQRHDDDNEPPPSSAASVPADSAVITIKGVCDRSSDPAPSGDKVGVKESSSSDRGKNDSPAASTFSACKTVVTKAQFERLVEALNPQMSGPARRQLAESYPRFLLFASRAHELGLDQDPLFAEAMRYASMRLLTERLTRYFEEQASSISDSDIEAYYKGNAIKFERAELLRIFVPKQKRQEQKTGSGEQSSTPIDSAMLTVAENIRARAVAGEDFQQLQKEAFEAASISSGSPNVSTGKIAAVRLPLDHQKVFEMEPGQLSDIIADASGYYIYKIVSKEKIPLTQARQEIRKSIASERVQDSTSSLGKSVRSELDEKYFGALPRRQHPSDQTGSKP